MVSESYDAYAMLVQDLKYIEHAPSARQLDLLRLMLVLGSNRNPIPRSIIISSGFTEEDITSCAFLKEDDGTYYIRDSLLDAAGLQLPNIDIQSKYFQNLIEYLACFDYYRAFSSKLSYAQCSELKAALNVIIFFAHEKDKSVYKLCERISAVLDAYGDSYSSFVYGVMWEHENYNGYFDAGKRIRQCCKIGYLSMAKHLIELDESIDFKTKAHFLCAEVEHYDTTGSIHNKIAALDYTYNALGNTIMKAPSNEYEFIRCAFKAIDLTRRLAHDTNQLLVRLPEMIKKISNDPARIKANLQVLAYKYSRNEDDLNILLGESKICFDEALKFGLIREILPLLKFVPASGSKGVHIDLSRYYEGLIDYFELKKIEYESGDMNSILVETKRQYIRMLVHYGQSGEVLVRLFKSIYETNYRYSGSYNDRKYLRYFNELMQSAKDLVKRNNEYSTLLSLLLIEYKMFLKYEHTGFRARGTSSEVIANELRKTLFKCGYTVNFDDWLTARLLDGGLS